MEEKSLTAVNLSTLFRYKGIKLLKSKAMFSFSIESILLANFVRLNSQTKMILDIGTNNGIMALILAKKCHAKIKAIEILPKACVIARQNVQLNNLKDRIEVIEGDFRQFHNNNKKISLIVCNPPFFAVNERYKNTRDNKDMAQARHEQNLSLDELLIGVRKLINHRGYFVFCHTVDRLPEVLTKCEQMQLMPKRLTFIHPFVDRPAKSFLIETRFQAKSGLIVTPPIICHNADLTFKSDIKEMYLGE